MVFFKLLMFCLVSVQWVNSKKGGSCEDLIVGLASSNSLFLQCTTKHGVPVTICTDCVTEYKNVEGSYEKFLKGNDSDSSCPDIYVDKDKLNIIAHTHEIIKNLWTEAYCKNCYNPDGTMSDETAEFDKYAIDYIACHSNANFCSNCKEIYVKLNRVFDELKEKYKFQVCFDIQDKMNRTRGNWTQECGHETPNASLVAFAAVSSTFMSIPVLFYCGFFLFTRRQERNHQILDSMAEAEPENPLPSTRQEPSTIASTSAGIAENHLDTGTSSKSKLINTSDDEDLLL